jgi:hypothetical protein
MVRYGVCVSDPRYFRQQAATCTRLADRTNDPETAEALRELAAEYERKARAAELNAG